MFLLQKWEKSREQDTAQVSKPKKKKLSLNSCENTERWMSAEEAKKSKTLAKT